jgi:hypothetical protein
VTESVNRSTQLTNPCLREDPAANEVYVTGTFDDWRRTVRLDKKGDVFEKSVELPSDQRVLYKASQGSVGI